MIVRIWRTGVDPDRASEYLEFARTTSLPMFRNQRGFRGVYFARRDDERVVITLWQNAAAVAELSSSATYADTVTAIEAQGFLRGESSVEVFEVEDLLLEQPLHKPSSQQASQIAADYDHVADAYVEHIYMELDGKPFDRELLQSFADAVGSGRVCDVGCGPGHVTRYLHEHGCDAFGVDISERMVERATALNPGIDFHVGDLQDLPVNDESLAGAVCLYSLIHLTVDELASALEALHRKLRPGGKLLVAVHEGTETRTPGELWGTPVSLQFNFFTAEQLEAAVLEAGFAIEETRRRGPYPDVEVETNRLYVVAAR